MGEFAFTARGTRSQTCDSLRALTPSLLGGSALAAAVRDEVVVAIERGAEPLGRYYVHVSGTDNPDGPLALSVTVSTDGLKREDQIVGSGGLRLPLKLEPRDYPRHGEILREDLVRHYPHTGRESFPDPA